MLAVCCSSHSLSPSEGLYSGFICGLREASGELAEQGLMER